MAVAQHTNERDLTMQEMAARSILLWILRIPSLVHIAKEDLHLACSVYVS